MNEKVLGFKEFMQTYSKVSDNQLKEYAKESAEINECLNKIINKIKKAKKQAGEK